MKESHIEGLANHNDPESCAGVCEDARRSVDRGTYGRSIEPRKQANPGADAVELSGRQHDEPRDGERNIDPARSEASSTYGNSMRENREVPGPPTASDTVGRVRKANRLKLTTHGPGKSDSPVVPTTQPNKAGQTVAEAVEGRGLTKENAIQTDTSRTQSRTNDVPSGLDRVRQAAKGNKQERFSALLHHVTVDQLKKAFYAVRRNAAPGTDGVTWRQYEEDIEENLRNLDARLHQGAFRAKPSRRAYIPKADGQQRPLGIASLEDKVAQRAVADVLNAIYEGDFLGFSYGFRPGRQAHVALDALAVGIRTKKISWVLDADIRGYFDAINHDWLMRFLEHRIADRRLLRLIKKWLKAGVIENGTWSPNDGSPQGASISPLLANVYLHYVLDLWVQQWRGREAKGDVIIVRWADDFVIGFQHETDGRRFLKELHDRFRKFSLVLHPEKTRLIRFGRFARRDAKRFDRKSKPETFDFLGFTHYCGENRNGKFMVCRTTMRKRLTATLKAVKLQLRKRMHDDIKSQGRWLASVVRGYYQYHAIPGNWKAIGTFRTQVGRLWYRTLRRRSQRKKLNWERMTKITDNWLPPARILHPYPEQRLAAIIRGRSPVR